MADPAALRAHLQARLTREASASTILAVGVASALLSLAVGAWVCAYVYCAVVPAHVVEVAP